MRDLIGSFMQWYLDALGQGGYLLVAFLMALESSLAPLPSEVVIPPAAYLAHRTGSMTLTGIVIAGAIGSWVGATMMYWGARLLGRPLVMRYGRYVLHRVSLWLGGFCAFLGLIYYFFVHRYMRR